MRTVDRPQATASRARRAHLAQKVGVALAAAALGLGFAPGALAAADPWPALHDLVQKVRVGDDAGVATKLEALGTKGSKQFRATAAHVLATVLARASDGKGARAALDKAGAVADIYTPATRWLEVQVLVAEGRNKDALQVLGKLRSEHPKWRWARADLLYSWLWEQTGPPAKAAEVALDLYPKSRLHLPQDELLHRAARMLEKAGDTKRAANIWKSILIKHPESRFAGDAAKRVDPAKFTDTERMARVELLFARRSYERCRAEALVLWKRNHRRVELGYFLGKIGSERLRDDYNGAEQYFKIAADTKSPYALFAISSYAIVLAKNGKTVESAAQFDRWLSLYGNSAPYKRVIEAYYDRSRSLHTGGKSLQAAADMRKALSGKVRGKLDRGKYWWFVGWWTYLGGKPREAIDLWAGMTGSSNALVGGKARYWTARAWDKLGKRKKAIEQLVSLVKNMPLNYYSGQAEVQLRAWGAGRKIPKRPDLSKVPDPVLAPFAGLPKDGAVGTIKIAAHMGEYDTLKQVWDREERALRKQIGTNATTRLRDRLADELEDFWTPRRRAHGSWKKARKGYPTANTVAAWRSRYPRAYRTHVAWSAKKHGAPEWMVYAHMLQESRYKPWMISGAPAYGLLELLDRTARRLATEAGEDYQLWMLMLPQHNVRWGTQYLGALYKKFHHQLPFAIGSYNGGPMLLEYHMQISKGLGVPEMIDDMGPHECRNYTRMVIGHFLRYIAIYETPKRAQELRDQLLLPKGWKNEYLPKPDY